MKMSFNREELLSYAVARVETTDVRRADYETVRYLLDHCHISVSENARFFVDVNCNGIQQEIYRKRVARFYPQWEEHGLTAGIRSGAFSGAHDFGHNAVVWERILSLGFVGIRRQIASYAEQYRDDPRRREFYEGLSDVYEGIFCFLRRAEECARRCGKNEMADGLFRLAVGAPRTLFDAMQLTVVYYVLQQMFDGSPLRTMGRIDSLFAPFCKGIAPEDLSGLVCDYIRELDRLRASANLPFALGGTDGAGNSLVNPLSYLFLDSYKQLKPVHVKLHLLCSRNTPEDFVRSGLDGVRTGKNSIVFLSDGRVIESLIRQGSDPEDAVKYHVVGCYECGAEGEITSSCNARVNLPKALELTLNEGVDMLTGERIIPGVASAFSTFSELFDAFAENLRYLCRCAMKTTDLIESRYREIHASPIFTSVNEQALESGGDIYTDYAAKYNNSSLNALGLATAVDSLAAIRKAVFEDRMMSLSEFTEMLRCDWEGREPLRLLIRNRYPKYGNGDPSVDALAGEITDALYKAVGGVPNAKGGIWRLGLFSINWRWEFGKKTAASADGRRSGEPLSQNSGASFGSDRKGATAHLLSVASLDTSKTPNGTIVDLDLHSSAVKGENGLAAMYATLKTYFDLGGFAVHYNVLDTEVLKAARKDPSAYPNLQVRLCGWNVLFSSLSEVEKDEFIARSEKEVSV